MTKNYFYNKRVWVTGASSGVGAAFVKEIVKQEPRSVVLSGRNVDRLSEIASQIQCGSTLILPFDVRDESATYDSVQKIQEFCGGVDIVFFNAGGSEHFSIDDFDVNAFRRLMEQNYYSIVYGVGASLPLLKKSTAPHIVGMSSVASFIGIPEAQGYSAAKAAARLFLEGLRGELLKYNIPVTIICPGFIDTPLVGKNKFPMPFIMSAEKAAKIIAKAIARRKPQLIFPRRMKWLVRFTYVLPRRFIAKVMIHSR